MSPRILCSAVLFFSSLVAIATSAPAAAQPQKPATPFEPRDLVGEWDSGLCGSYVRAAGTDPVPIRRQYLFTEDQFSVRYTFYADAACSRTLFVVRTSGPYRLGATVAGRPQARAVDVIFEKRFLTIEAPEMLARVANCGRGNWQVGVQQDISDTACLVFKSKAQCGADYDIVTIADGVLFPGLRTPDMCTPAGRPTELQTTGGAKRR